MKKLFTILLLALTTIGNSQDTMYLDSVSGDEYYWVIDTMRLVPDFDTLAVIFLMADTASTRFIGSKYDPVDVYYKECFWEYGYVLYVHNWWDCTIKFVDIEFKEFQSQFLIWDYKPLK